jgi:hypothetical protein
VWEHKLHVAPRNIVPGDGPFAGYNRWLQHFYSPATLGWQDAALGGPASALEW